MTNSAPLSSVSSISASASRTTAARRALALSAVVVAGLLASPVAARAQKLNPTSLGGAVSASSRANDLDARAAAIEDSATDARARRAGAELREGAAQLRGSADVRGAVSLRWAAYDRYEAGDVAASATLMESAAAQAATAGDRRAAVRSYVDAAVIALELKQPARVLRLVGAARSLADAAGVSADEAAALRAIVAMHFTS